MPRSRRLRSPCRTPALALAAQPVSGSGSLSLLADRVALRRWRHGAGWFCALLISAPAQGMTAAGAARLRSGADLTLDYATAQRRGRFGASRSLPRAARCALATPPGTVPAVAATPVGAALAVEAGSIVADTRLVYPAGRVRLVADDGVSLGANGRIDVSGRRLSLGGAPGRRAGGSGAGGGPLRRRGLPARLAAWTCRRAAARPVPAGSAFWRAARATLAGDSSAPAPPRIAAAPSVLTADTLADFTALNQQLNAGGFERRRSIETLVRRPACWLPARPCAPSRSPSPPVVAVWSCPVVSMPGSQRLPGGTRRTG